MIAKWEAVGNYYASLICADLTKELHMTDEYENGVMQVPAGTSR